MAAGTVEGCFMALTNARPAPINGKERFTPPGVTAAILFSSIKWMMSCRDRVAEGHYGIAVNALGMKIIARRAAC